MSQHTTTREKTTFTATDAKNQFGRLLDAARRRPITIEKNGRPVAIVLSLEDYDAFEKIDNEDLLEQATKAAQEGSIGLKRSKALHESFLHA